MAPIGELKVVCVGLSRTGTSSLKAALSMLLPGNTFHAMDFLNSINERQSFQFWKKMEDKTASEDDIKSFFSAQNYSAVCDVPCLLYWKKIVLANPNAKVILTIRDPNEWYNSISKALVPISGQITRFV